MLEAELQVNKAAEHFSPLNVVKVVIQGAKGLFLTNRCSILSYYYYRDKPINWLVKIHFYSQNDWSDVRSIFLYHAEIKQEVYNEGSKPLFHN